MSTLDLEQMLRRMDLLHRLTLAARSGHPWRPAVDRSARWAPARRVASR